MYHKEKWRWKEIFLWVFLIRCVCCAGGGLFGTGEESGRVHILIYMIIQQTSKFSDVFAGLDVVLQIRVFQLLHSFQDIIALFAQVIHVGIVFGEFGGSEREHVVLA